MSDTIEIIGIKRARWYKRLFNSFYDEWDYEATVKVNGETKTIGLVSYDVKSREKLVEILTHRLYWREIDYKKQENNFNPNQMIGESITFNLDEEDKR